MGGGCSPFRPFRCGAPGKQTNLGVHGLRTEVHIFARHLAMDPFFPDFFLVQRVLGEFDGVI